MRTLFLYFLLYLSFLVFGAYATTDILRLLSGSSTPVNAAGCYCPICKNKIALSSQIPVFSYIKNKGACKNCHAPIPFSDLFLEVFISLGFSVITMICRFSWTGFFLCICLYEGTKIFYIIRKGTRQQDFWRNFSQSLLNNLVLFFFLGIVFLFCQ